MQVTCPECGENVGAKDKLPKHLKALFWVSMNTSGGGDVRIGISASNVMISHTSPNILILKITKMLSTPKTTPQKMISQCKCPLWSNILGCKSSLTITHVNCFTQSLPLSSAYQTNIVVLVVPICIKVVLDWKIEVIISEWRSTGLNFHKEDGFLS